MKKIILLVILISIIACKKEESVKEEPGVMDAVENLNNLSKVTDVLKNYEKRVEELKKLQPVKKEVYKEILLEQLGDLKRTDYSVGDLTFGLNMGTATYGVDSKTVKVTIFDGAGETGSGLVYLTFITLSMDKESVNGTTTEKTEDIDGIRCLTKSTIDPDYVSSVITFIHNERFQITFDGSQIGLEELKKYVKQLDLSKLK